MALFDDFLKSDIGRGLLIGAGVLLAAPVVVVAMAGVARPVARAVVKTGIIGYEKGREALAEIGEVMDDLVAEARAEIERGQVGAVSVGRSAPESRSGADGGDPT